MNLKRFFGGVLGVWMSRRNLNMSTDGHVCVQQIFFIASDRSSGIPGQVLKERIYPVFLT